MDAKLGWIKVYRSLRQHWVWSRPFSPGQAWVDLLLRANHAARKVKTKSGFITIERGQVLISTRNLAEDWGWSRGRIRRFLSHLEKDEMCSLNESSDGTIITLENYGFGQDQRPTDETIDEADAGTTDGPRTVPKQENRELKTATIQRRKYSPEFDAFFTEYPRKDEKAKAARAFAARIKDGSTPEQMILGARYYAEHIKATGTELRFVKLAATFLGPDQAFQEWQNARRDASPASKKQESPYSGIKGWG